MKRKIVLFIMLIISMLLLNGCWSRKELNELSIVSAIGIDKSEDGYLVTVQIINPSEVAGQSLTNRVAVSTYRRTGKTVFEALRRLTLTVPRKIYLSHMRLLVFGEDLAKEGIEKTLDFFSRDHEVRTDFYIMVAKNAMATDGLNVLTPLEKIPANKVYSSIEVAQKEWAPVQTVQLDELISWIVSEGREPVLTGMILDGDLSIGSDLENVEHVDVPTTIRVNSIAVFKNDRLIGWLDEKESRGYNAVMGDIKNSVVTLPCKDNGNLAVEVLSTQSDITGEIENGVPKINVKFKIEANVGEVACDVDLTKVEIISEIEKTLEEKSKEYIELAIKKAQKDLESDIFGFGEVIYREDPKVWKDLKGNWDEEFESLEISIDVKAKIRRLGTVTESFLNETNKEK